MPFGDHFIFCSLNYSKEQTFLSGVPKRLHANVFNIVVEFHTLISYMYLQTKLTELTLIELYHTFPFSQTVCTDSLTSALHSAVNGA